MVYAEELVLNPVTGRCAWALRHIPSGKYGDPYDWSLVIVRPHWFSRTAVIKLCEGMKMSKRRAIQKKLIEMRFKKAAAVEGGETFRWPLSGVRKKTLKG